MSSKLVFYNKACSKKESHFEEKVTDGRDWQIIQLMILVYDKKIKSQNDTESSLPYRVWLTQYDSVVCCCLLIKLGTWLLVVLLKQTTVFKNFLLNLTFLIYTKQNIEF